MHRICVYHVGQDHIPRAAALCGEITATMCCECIYYQVDAMAGDNAAYLCTPKNPGCPTYEVNLLQFWINRMIHTATQSRFKDYGPSNTVSRARTMTWYISTITLGESMLIRTQQNLHRRLMDMVTVVC